MSMFDWLVAMLLVHHSAQQNKISTHLYIFALFNTPITTIWRYGILKLYTLSISSVLLVSESIIIVPVLCTSGSTTVHGKHLWNVNSRFYWCFNGLSRPHSCIKPAILLLILKLEVLNLLIVCLTLKFYKAKQLLWAY